MQEISKNDCASVCGGLRPRIEYCQGATTLLFAGAGAVIGGGAGFGFGTGAGFSVGGTIGGAVGTIFCPRFFSNQ